MDKPETIAALINAWSPRAALVQELCAILEPSTVTLAQVHKWARNGSIPPKYHQAIIVAARRRGVDFRAEDIVRLHACKTSQEVADAQ